MLSSSLPVNRHERHKLSGRRMGLRNRFDTFCIDVCQHPEFSILCGGGSIGDVTAARVNVNALSLAAIGLIILPKPAG
ncbi:hypothetical protein [Bradyrhizobium sp. 33ap4]|uniref:hypothetical protein n=1 Tax=Bradyrhizobium sp. 33ap4 TaxID=3061630 RepID=UPI00292FAFB3|nr:hypothetical protein [Bradyrhizobium sp. 33ap4]